MCPWTAARSGRAADASTSTADTAAQSGRAARDDRGIEITYRRLEGCRTTSVAGSRPVTAEGLPAGTCRTRRRSHCPNGPSAVRCRPRRQRYARATEYWRLQVRAAGPKARRSQPSPRDPDRSTSTCRGPNRSMSRRRRRWHSCRGAATAPTLQALRGASTARSPRSGGRRERQLAIHDQGRVTGRSAPAVRCSRR